MKRFPIISEGGLKKRVYVERSHGAYEKGIPKEYVQKKKKGYNV